MKNFLLLATLLTTSLTSFGQVKKDFHNLTFNSVEVSGAFNVYLRMGDDPDVTVVADEDLIDRIEVDVINDVLEIELEQDWWNWAKQNGDVDIYITLKTVKSLSFSGACVVSSKNTLRGTTLSLETSGACKIDTKLAFNTLDIDVSGASKLTFSGTCKKVNVDASGACAIYAAPLQTESMRLEVSGASKAEVWATQTLHIEASGACKVSYKGNPEVTQEVSGASSIVKM
jgi:hypothetical protein